MSSPSQATSRAIIDESAYATAQASSSDIESLRNPRATNYSNDYRLLLNDCIRELTEYETSSITKHFAAQQIGASFWTSQEKHTLFKVLPIAGRDNVYKVAAAIETKSEFEVAEYLNLLRLATYERSQKSMADYELGIDDAPAAIEIGAKCEAALDLAATGLISLVQETDQEAEQDRYGNYWLLHSGNAHAVQHAFLTNRAAETSVARLPSRIGHADETSCRPHQNTRHVKAANLLNLPNWIGIMGLLTRYDSTYDEAYTAAEKLGSSAPSMYQSAFNDFHSLTISLTRRLVQAVIFQATSRHRSAKENRHSRPRGIRHPDVTAAIQTLGLKDDWYMFWVGCARRNLLNVRTVANSIIHDKQADDVSSAQYLSYDEVESALRRSDADFVLSTEENVAQSVERDAQMSIHEDSSDSDFWTDTSSDEIDIVGVDEEAAQSEVSSDPPSETESEMINDHSRGPSTETSARKAALARDLAQDELIEAFDRARGAQEEAQLMEMLRLREPVKHEVVETKPPLLPFKPSLSHSEAYWRETADYHSEWEQYGRPVPVEEFARLGDLGRAAKRRRLERCAMEEDNATSDTTPSDADDEIAQEPASSAGSIAQSSSLGPTPVTTAISRSDSDVEL